MVRVGPLGLQKSRISSCRPTEILILHRFISNSLVLAQNQVAILLTACSKFMRFGHATPNIPGLVFQETCCLWEAIIPSAGFENERRPSSKQLDICIRNGGHDDNVLRPRHSIFDSFDRHDKLFAQLLDQYNAQTDVLSWWRPRKRQDER